MTDLDTLIQKLKGMFGADGAFSDLATQLRTSFREEEFHLFQKQAADAMASTATTETPCFKARVALDIIEISVLPGAGLTADNANNAVITVQRRNADGTGAVTVATMTTNVASGNWTAWVSKLLTLTAANVRLTAGQILTINITKGGTGVVVPISHFRCLTRVA